MIPFNIRVDLCPFSVNQFKYFILNNPILVNKPHKSFEAPLLDTTIKYWTEGKEDYPKDDYWPHDTTLRMKDSQGNDAPLSYYFFKDFGPHLRSIDVGAAHPPLNRNHVHQIEIGWTPLPGQKAIADTSGPRDAKIEANQPMNTTPEGMTQKLLHSWFVDFDPVIHNTLAPNNPIPTELAPRTEVRKKALGERSSSYVASSKFISGTPQNHHPS